MKVRLARQVVHLQFNTSPRKSLAVLERPLNDNRVREQARHVVTPGLTQDRGDSLQAPGRHLPTALEIRHSNHVIVVVMGDDHRVDRVDLIIVLEGLNMSRQKSRSIDKRRRPGMRRT